MSFVNLVKQALNTQQIIGGVLMILGAIALIVGLISYLRRRRVEIKTIRKEVKRHRQEGVDPEKAAADYAAEMSNFRKGIDWNLFVGCFLVVVGMILVLWGLI